MVTCKFFRWLLIEYNFTLVLSSTCMIGKLYYSRIKDINVITFKLMWSDFVDPLIVLSIFFSYRLEGLFGPHEISARYIFRHLAATAKQSMQNHETFKTIPLMAFVYFRIHLGNIILLLTTFYKHLCDASHNIPPSFWDTKLTLSLASKRKDRRGRKFRV